MLLKVDASKNREAARFGSLPGRNHSFVPQVVIWKHLMSTLALFLLLRVRMELWATGILPLAGLPLGCLSLRSEANRGSLSIFCYKIYPVSRKSLQEVKSEFLGLKKKKRAFVGFELGALFMESILYTFSTRVDVILSLTQRALEFRKSRVYLARANFIPKSSHFFLFLFFIFPLVVVLTSVGKISPR